MFSRSFIFADRLLVMIAFVYQAAGAGGAQQPAAGQHAAASVKR